MADDVVLLNIWDGDWGLPSVDPDCLAAVTYCKFSGVPVRLVKSNNPFKSPSAFIWLLKLSSRKHVGVCIPCYAGRCNQGILHTWWVDDTTYRDVTRPWFAKAIPFPYNFFIPWKTQRSASFYVYCSFENTACTEDEVHAVIYKEAKECLNQLSYYLGEKEFFFGSEPTSLDALVFSYVGPLIKAPLPANQLTNHLKGCENLFALCNRILNRYLRPSAEEMEKLRKKAEEEKLKATDELEFPHQKLYLPKHSENFLPNVVCTSKYNDDSHKNIWQCRYPSNLVNHELFRIGSKSIYSTSAIGRPYESWKYFGNSVIKRENIQFLQKLPAITADIGKDVKICRQ
ncbi:hypothetical protein KUTeg_018374, partial [Tegillarca granosa]